MGGRAKRTASKGSVKAGAKATRSDKKNGKPQMSRPAKRSSAKKAVARKPANVKRTSISTGKGGRQPRPPAPARPRSIIIGPKRKDDFKPVDNVRVQDPNDNSKLIDTLSLIGRGKVSENSYVARELQSDGDGPLAGKYNNRGCAHAWLGQLAKARAAFRNAINEAKKMSGGAKIRKIAEYNLGLLTR